MRQWIKDLNSQNSIEVSHGKANNIWVDSASWNSDGSKIVYLVTNTTSCRYFIREFKAMKLGKPTLLHNCTSGSYGKIAYTHDDNKVVFSENEGRNTAFTLFEMNLTTRVKRRLNQPKLFLGGNSQFDLHPNQNKLLISSPDRQIWEGFYALDLDTDELKLLFKQDAFICCGRWSHNGERVVLMGEHPANQLVSFDLTGNDKRIIYTGSEQVSVPERHSNGRDYLFPIVLLNQNVNYFNFESTTSTLTAHSSVDDRLATFAHHDNQLLAYISLSTGTEEVWLTDIDGKHQQKLTDFNDSRHYIDLLWSYNGDNLLGVTLNEIHLISKKAGHAQTLKIPQVEIRGVSWKNDHTVSYSIKNKKNWHVQYYDIETHQVKDELSAWQYIRYSQRISDTIWQNMSNKLYYGAKPDEITDDELLQAGLRIGRTFNLKKIGAKWAWQKRVNDKYQLMMKNSIDLKAKEILSSDSFHFDISNRGMLFQTQEFLAADIYQTVSKH
jgi:Tol biopolymer transport system component